MKFPTCNCGHSLQFHYTATQTWAQRGGCRWCECTEIPPPRVYAKARRIEKRRKILPDTAWHRFRRTVRFKWISLRKTWHN